MAPPPQFSMYSPKPPEEGGGDVDPVFGLGRAHDPGFWASTRSGTFLGQWRVMALVLGVAPVLILAVTPLIVQNEGGRFDGPAWPLCLPLVAAALVAAFVAPRVPRPLPTGMPPAETVRAALFTTRQAILVRFALTEGVILCGLPLAMIARDELVFAVGFVLGYPLLVWQILPTAGAIERLRTRLESGGAESHLWAALLAPVPRIVAARDPEDDADGPEDPAS
ncbi:hypothetical protein [Actinomadura flavalba]|uniref:hypothetical protein n=1 Tax=Actinomadura flavalba TaxID=1120938 RepID=UPI0012DE2B39|nr:hypothetical protein [Actinomadura flavalba]